MSDSMDTKPNMTQACSPKVNSLLGRRTQTAEQMHILELPVKCEAVTVRADSTPHAVWYHLHNNCMGQTGTVLSSPPLTGNLQDSWSRDLELADK